MNLLGIDVSVNNGHINWDLVKTDPQNIKFAFIKTTEGATYRDPYRAENAYGASHAGLKFGYYHFCSINKLTVIEDASQEAAAFIAAMKGLPVATLPAVLDIETDELNLPPDQVALWAETFLTAVKLAGYPVMIYSGPYFLNEHLPIDHKLGEVKLWLAEYSASLSMIPHGWTHADVWQFTSKGKVNGISTMVDMNRSDLNF